MTDIRKVVLMGASGVLGSAILTALRPNHDFDITVLSRPTSQTTFPSDVKVIHTTYDQSSLERVFTGQDAVIYALGLATIPDQKLYVDACITAGVKRYITNDFGNAPDFQGLSELEFARKPKQDVLKYIQHQANTHSSFTWTSLDTGHFLDYAITKFPAFGFTLASRSARLVDDGTEPFSATTLSDIGFAVAQILRRPQDTANRQLLVRSIETTQREILAALEQQTDTVWHVEHVSSKDLYESGKEKVRTEGGRAAILTLLPVQIFEKGAGRSTFPKERYDNKLLGLGERTVDEVVRDILAKEKK